MNAIKIIWSFFKPNETILVIFGVFLVLCAVTAAAMYRNSESAKFTGTVRYENLSPEQRRQIESVSDEIRIGETDSNLRFAERLREASSIGLGLSLYLVRERVANNRFLTLAEMMTEFSKSDLLPPACQVLLSTRPTTEYGMVQTARGTYFIRYSPAPLKLEILSAGKNGLEDGATFLVRVPDTSAAKLPVNANSSKVTSAGAWATLFEAPLNQNHYIPPPFAPVQSFAAMNWQIRPLRQTELSAERMQELNGFLQRNN